jgi:ribose-phosphate pyrophosphokinase
MIRLQAFNEKNFSVATVVVKPTIFPDGTSQVWKLPEDMLSKKYFRVIWNFEQEREIFDIYNLKLLLGSQRKDVEVTLHIPYLPFARQDKGIDNQATFALRPFCWILNDMNFDKITAVDVHNPRAVAELIHNFENIDVTWIHQRLIDALEADLIVFPDNGAYERYNDPNFRVPAARCTKVRNQQTGEITDLSLEYGGTIPKAGSILIIDDICDGGATFVKTAQAIRKVQQEVKIYLFVTHGIFSKGKNLEGIYEVFSTNSLIKNVSGYEVSV